MVFLVVVVSSIFQFVFNIYESIIIEKFRDFNGENVKLKTGAGEMNYNGGYFILWYQKKSVTKVKLFAIFVAYYLM